MLLGPADHQSCLEMSIKKAGDYQQHKPSESAQGFAEGRLNLSYRSQGACWACGAKRSPAI